MNVKLHWSHAARDSLTSVSIKTENLSPH